MKWIEDLHRVCHQIWASVGVENKVTDQVLVIFLVSGFEVYGALEPQASSMGVALGLHSLKSMENGFCIVQLEYGDANLEVNKL
jgi:hypothetical protein